MDVNTQYNIITSSEFFSHDLQSREDRELTAEQKTGGVDIEQFRTAREDAEAREREKVMMDLRDVQHFLFMLIGSEIKIIENNSVPGAGLDISA